MEDALILLAVILGLAVVLAPIGVLIQGRKIRALTERIAVLEAKETHAPLSENSIETGDAPAASQSNAAPWVAPEVKRQRALAAQTEQDIQNVSQDVIEPRENATPRAFVFRAQTLQQGLDWIKENWFLGIAAISLALAGVFMVQYGVEQGLLTPFARVMGALILGLAFIGVGEFTRRRFGDETGTLTAMPSTFSGAGIVTLFAAILSARHLYDMLPSDLALLALLAVAALSVVLGWFYGPFLAAVGVLGALAAPFVVGGSSDAPHVFFYYFALIVLVALAIDAVRRWAWLSVLALIAGTAASWLLLRGGADGVHALGFALITFIGASAIPVRRIWPNHSGASITEMVLSLRGKAKRAWPEFPTRVAAGTFVAALVLCGFVAIETSNLTVAWLAVCSIAALGVLALVWLRNAPALEDLSLLAPLVLLGLIWVFAVEQHTLYQAFATLPELEADETRAMPLAVSAFTAMFAIFAMLGFWRAAQGVRGSLIWIGASALALPAVFGALELSWAPVQALTPYAWAAHALAAAAVMTLLAERSAKRWPKDMRPAALFAMSALSLVVFGMMMVLSAAALSVAIAAMIVIAALIDRRFDMAWLGLFIQLAVAVLGWRFIVDPGLFWATNSNVALWEILLGYLIPLVLMTLGWWLLRPLQRLGAQLALESAVWSLGPVFVLILLERALGSDFDGFWGVSLAGSVLLISMGAQLYRWRSGMRFGILRALFAAILGTLALVTLFIGLVGMSPLTYWGARDIAGPLVFDTIALAYLVPAAVLGVLVWKLTHLAKPLRISFAAGSAVLTLAYVALEIRRFWQGSDIARAGVSQGELYSYTIAMMLASVALLLFAFSRRSTVLRKLAMAGIAVTIAKVFLIDMSGLTGLIRVASFLGLGLALSALAWLHRAMNLRWDRGDFVDTQAALDPEQ